VVPLQSNGTATFSIASAEAAYINVTASYSGDSTNAASSASNYVTANCNSDPATLSGARGNVPLSIVGGARSHGTEYVTVTNPTDSRIRETDTMNMYLLDSQNHLTLVGSVRRGVNVLPGRSARYAVPVNLSYADSTIGEAQFLFNLMSPTGQTSVGYGIYLNIAAPVVTPTITTSPIRPETIAPGHFGQFVLTVTNNGNVTATGVMTISLVASTDGITTVPGGTLGVVHPSIPVNIRPGHSGRYVVRFQVPAGLPEGLYFPITTVAVDGASATGFGYGISVD
jgi:hypothetical protein